MKRSAIGLAIILTAAYSAIAQKPTSAAKNDLPRLKVAKTQELRRAEGSIVLPAKCDQEGNLYLRFYAQSKAHKAPLRKFSPEGNELAAYSLPSDPSFQAKGAGVLDFAIGKNGQVFLLAALVDGFYVLKYDKGGTLASRIKLQTRFTPSRFQPFDSGELLVTGVGRGTEASPFARDHYRDIRRRRHVDKEDRFATREGVRGGRRPGRYRLYRTGPDFCG